MLTPSPRRRFALRFALLGALACSSTDDTGILNASPGRAAFSIADIEQDVTAIEYLVANETGDVVVAENLRPDSGRSVSFVLELPAGGGYSIALTAHTRDGQTCSGRSSFDVASRERVDVNVALECEGNVGEASVTGTLVPAATCPKVEIATAVRTAEVGSALILSTSVDGNIASSPVWTASGGELTTTDGVTRLTCTEPGTVSVSLMITDGGCNPTDTVDVTCAPAAPAASACDGLGSTCHVVATTSDAAHECHELGHSGDEAACATGRRSCIDTCGDAICTELASLCHDVDPGSGPIHDCHDLGHGADATACFARGRECFDLCTRAHDEPVTIRFAAQVGDAAFTCGRSYENAGSTGVTVQPQDFRFFVHDVRLVSSDGTEVPIAIDDRVPFQALGTALLDFENGTGACLSGDAALNTTVTGHAPPGTYTGIAFRVGVPETVNHNNPALQPTPLAAGGMAWGWLAGYRFLRAELGAEAGGGVLHVGSAACTGDPVAGSVTCARPNRANVTLSSFDVATDTIVADIAAIFAGTNLATGTLCHSSGAPCEPMFESLGIDLASGQNEGGQRVFRVTR